MCGKGVLMMNGKKMLLLVVRGLILLIFFIGIPIAHGVPGQEVLRVTPGQFESGVVEEGQVIAVTATIENQRNSAVEITNVRTN
jgi:hypothetical protein